MATRPARGNRMAPTTTTEVIVHEPTVSIKVETLFSQVNNKMEQISRDITNLVEMGHKKADKVELEKVETVLGARLDKVDGELSRRVGDLEKSSATIIAVKDNETKLDELSRSYKMHWISTAAALLIGLGSILVTLLRH